LDIDSWLRRIGLTQYAEMFRADDVGGELLRRMTNDDLKEVGVVSFGHRKKLFGGDRRIGQYTCGLTRGTRHSDTDSHRRRAASNFCIGRRGRLSSTPHESANDIADR
jgi:hypothetical protein